MENFKSFTKTVNGDSKTLPQEKRAAIFGEKQVNVMEEILKNKNEK